MKKRNDSKRADSLMEKVRYLTSYEGSKITACESISTQADSMIFNILIMNESLSKEMSNVLQKRRPIMADDFDLIAHLNAIYLKLIISIADSSDIETINLYLDMYENNELTNMELIQYFNEFTASVDVSNNFRKNSIMYLNSILK